MGEALKDVIRKLADERLASGQDIDAVGESIIAESIAEVFDWANNQGSEKYWLSLPGLKMEKET